MPFYWMLLIYQIANVICLPINHLAFTQVYPMYLLWIMVYCYLNSYDLCWIEIICTHGHLQPHGRQTQRSMAPTEPAISRQQKHFRKAKLAAFLCEVSVINVTLFIDQWSQRIYFFPHRQQQFFELCYSSMYCSPPPSTHALTHINIYIFFYGADSEDRLHMTNLNLSLINSQRSYQNADLVHVKCPKMLHSLRTF